MTRVFVAAVVLVLVGCGQKGPLSLPDQGGEVVTRPAGGQTQQNAPPSQTPSQSPSSEGARQPSTETPPDTTTKPDPKAKPKS